MKELLHNEKKVIYQSGKKSFTETLENKGVEYVELPILFDDEIKILKYVVDGAVKYAVEEYIGSNGEDGYRIFITETVPEDGWNELYTDCRRQLSGEEPAKIKNRFRLVVDKINTEITKRKSDNCSDLFSAMFDSDYTEADWQYFASRVAMFGYGIENIDKASEGIDKDFVSELKKYM